MDGGSSRPGLRLSAVQSALSPGTLILETEFQTETGVATVCRFHAVRQTGHDLVRIVIGRSGRVEFRTDSWCASTTGRRAMGESADDGAINAIAGPERLFAHAGRALRRGSENAR